MKKSILLFVFICVYAISMGQNLNEKRAIYFTEAAAKEFDLTKVQKNDLLTTRTEYLKSMAELTQKGKKGELTDDDQKSKRNELNSAFKKEMTRLTGKTEKELEPFYVRMREELQQVN